MQDFHAPRIHLSSLVAILLALVGGAWVARAQSDIEAGARVELRSVKFAQVRAASGGGTWTEGVVELGVIASSEGGTYARWAGPVRVALQIAIRKRSGEFDFYRATAEAVALEAGRASFRFYLPPEIARREQLTSAEPHSWLVEITVAGQPQSAGPAHASPLLASPDALRSFKDRVARQATLNDGVLVPQQDSPFADAYAGETPTFVHR